MTQNGSGGPKATRGRVDLLFGIVFLIASVRWVAQNLLFGVPIGTALADSRFWLVLAISLVFFASLRVTRLRVVEPFIFLLCAMIPFLEFTESIFGFGLFAAGAILLFVDGRLSRFPRIGLTLLASYLVALLIGSMFVRKTPIEMVIAILLFMTAFFLFLFLTFQDKIIVFVKAAKPVVHLSKQGLTEKEATHLLGLLSGKSSKEIAWELGVKESTIRNSLSRAYHRLGFADKTQLLQWAEGHDVQP